MAAFNSRILVTGSTGMLGQDIYKTLSSDYDVFGVDIQASLTVPEEKQILGDLTDAEFLEQTLKEVKPEVIIHCAAIVDLRKCEDDRPFVDRLHLDVTSQLVAYGAKVVFISTDSVFDGKTGDYREDDRIAPLNYYGESKWKGEEMVRRNPNHLILRTNIFGFTCPFKGSISEWALSSFQNSERIFGFTDIYFNTIYTKHLADIIGKLLHRRVKGTLHAASRNSLSKYSFLKYLEMRYTGSVGLVEGSEFSEMSIYPERPANPTLNVDKLKELVEVPTVEDGIDALLIDFMEVRDECNQTR